MGDARRAKRLVQVAGGWTNGTVLGAIACLGGFLARKGDGSPGWKTIWQGWHKLATMVEGVRLLLRP